MFELTIDNQVYQFNFGMGFVKEISKTVKVPVEGTKNVDREVGLRYKVAGILDGDIMDLLDILDIANKGTQERVTRAALEAYVEKDDTDIDTLFERVLDFLKNANCTRKMTLKILKDVEEAKAKN